MWKDVSLIRLIKVVFILGKKIKQPKCPKIVIG